MSAFANQHELFTACRELFGPEIDISAEFLRYLQPEGVKAAFRQRARSTHPDLLPSSQLHGTPTHHEPFIKVKESYEILSNYLEHRRPVLTREIWRRRSHQREQSESFLPRCQLRFGRFLYHSGVIPFTTLLDSLTWQRSTYPRLGALCITSGLLTLPEIHKIVTHSHAGKFGEKAIALGLLSAAQVKKLLLRQTYHKKPLGDFFIQQGILTVGEVAELVRKQRLHNASTFRKG